MIKLLKFIQKLLVIVGILSIFATMIILNKFTIIKYINKFTNSANSEILNKKVNLGIHLIILRRIMNMGMYKKIFEDYVKNNKNEEDLNIIM